MICLLRRTLAAVVLSLGAVLTAPMPAGAFNTLEAAGLPALSPEDKAYAASRGPVTLCVDPDWAPFEIINPQGQHEGIAADLLRLAAERVGLDLHLVPTANWDETIAASKAGRCTLMSFLNQTPKREEWLIFTQPLFTDVNVFITRAEHPFIVDPATLENETIAFPKGTAMEERIRADYPNLKILVVDEERDAIAAVSEQKADMTLRSLIVAAYTIRKEGLFNLKITGQLPAYENLLRVGVAKTEPRLRDLLNKGIASITPMERGQIVSRHVTITVEKGIDYDLIGRIGAAAALVVLVSLFWVWRLRQANQRLAVQAQTDTLTGLANRSRLNQDLPREIERARRTGRPLAVMLIDIDHFKQVNDQFGHLVGDAVLIAFAALLRGQVRPYDLVGRWGGEEFLILCPDTDAAQAEVLARRLADAARDHPFPTGRHHTLSAGVTALKPGESLDALLLRADDALYAAKDGGRDQVVRAM